MTFCLKIHSRFVKIDILSKINFDVGEGHQLAVTCFGHKKVFLYFEVIQFSMIFTARHRGHGVPGVRQVRLVDNHETSPEVNRPLVVGGPRPLDRLHRRQVLHLQADKVAESGEGKCSDKSDLFAG